MKKFLLFAVVAILFAACTQDVAVEILSPNIADDAPETLTVGFEGDDTRIQLNENVKTVWTNGDQVSVFYRSDANQKWEYTGETGARIADLTRVDEGVATEDMKRVVVVYPYNENYYINTDTFNVQATLPAVQTYLKDSYGLNGNIMISQSEYNNFSLKSVCGWLKLQLTGNGEKVKSITLRGNNGEQVAGELYINSADATVTLSSDTGSADDGEIGGVGGDLVFEDTILKEVTLDCDEGVELGAEATAFYIALPPQTFENGLTIEIEDTDALKMTKSTDKTIVIERNTIQPMAMFGYEGDFEKSEYCLTAEFELDENYLNTYVYWFYPTEETNSLVNIDYGDGTFGKNRMHTYPSVGNYVVKYYFERPITEITHSAFVNSAIKSIIIPNEVVKIGSMAFSISKLASISFEKDSKLTTIEQGAFTYCHNLKSISLPNTVTEIGDCVFGACYSLESISGGGSDFSTALGIFYKYLGGLDAHVVAYPASLNLETISYGPFYHDIGWGAFIGCKYLKELDINISKIYQCNFWECEQLEYIRLDQTTYIQNEVFKDCPKLEYINLPIASEIGENCFINNESLTSIDLGCDELKLINKIGNNNPSLSTLWIPAGVTTISDSFNSCAAITEVYCKAVTPPALTNSFDSMVAPTIYVPAESVNSYKSADGWKEFASYIVGYDFENGEIVEMQPNNEIWYTATATVEPYNTSAFGANIISNEWDAETGKGVITFDGEVTVIGEDAFFSFTLTAEIMSGDSLTDISIPESVTAIGQNAFYGCNNLTSITIPDSVITIGEHAFRETYLKNITLGNGVQRIEHAAFMKCSFTSITFPESLTHIAHDMCFDCSSLETVYFKSATPPSIIKYNSFGEPFRWCDNLVAIYVPSSGYSAYRSTFPYELYYKFEIY